MTKFIAILIGMGFLANAALAAGESIAGIDTNGDGIMTVDEIQAVYPEITAEVFAEVDTNNDGVLDEAELLSGQEQGLLPILTDG
jgi:hypothetical protein